MGEQVVANEEKVLTLKELFEIRDALCVLQKFGMVEDGLMGAVQEEITDLQGHCVC